MKRLIIKALPVALLAGLIGCQEKLDTVGGQTAQAVYMDKGNALINITNDGGETFIEPRLASLARENTTVEIAVVDFFEEYNKANSTVYRMLPTSEYELYEEKNPTNVSKNGRLSLTVEKGGYSSRVGIRAKNLDPEVYPMGIKYAIPLRIVSSSAKSILSNKDAVVTFNRPLKTSVAKIARASNTQVVFDPAIESSNEFTLQAHFIFTSVTTTNQTTINIGGAESEHYTRVLNPGGLQVKDNGGDGEASWTNIPMETGKWYQITHAYKDNNLKLYVNGVLLKTFVRPGLGIVQGKANIYVAGTTYQYTADQYLREVRVWNRALTEAEINDGLYLPVDPNSEGLVVYLPINEKDGFNDVTKYNNVVTPPREFEWIQNVKFPAEGLEIEE